MIRRLVRFGPSVLASGLSVATLFRLATLLLHEPVLEGGTEAGGQSIFVYAMY